ncbi:ribonuclease HIII [Enterococcus sp. 8G7_MSG3316]|uniref:Ribonuclease HIII n=1 Tax=Candidatus Enterococcus testudinis TaxID=1834191 RepID=A0A242A8U9_9ENTE|nr:ribonuclease HIII [Enterococcus sp. 8G7_MSG3316]OTN77349.1 ribonuclease HIII [Enterococcus sp. 8G7_MSG3316]
MSATVIKVSPAEMKKITQYYQSDRLPKTAPYTLFTAKKNQTTITAYQSGKVMFQGTNAEKEAALWGSPTASKSKQTTDNPLPAGFSEKSAIGSDEVGNGSYLGPLVVCAVYADQAHLPALKALGVKDSKMLTDQQIRAMAPKIKDLVPFQLLTVTPEKYNQIQPAYNTVRMKVALHNQAIRLLLEKIAPQKPEAILIDQFTSEKNYRTYLQSEKHAVTAPLYFATKGEQYHLSVAAASILCRTVFLDELDQASKNLGFKVPSGAGHASDLVAAKILHIGGEDLLGKYAKLHFANTEKAQKLANKS